MKRQITNALLAVTLIGFTVLGIANITKTNHKLKTQDIKLQSKQSDLQLLELKFTKLNIDLEREQGQKTLDQQKIDDLQKQKDVLQKQLDDAQHQLQAKLYNQQLEREKLNQVAQNVSITASASASSNDFYKMYIYQHESSNNPSAVNSIGCRGIGQACPGSKLPCDADYACQDAWFTNYAMVRYGSWYNAYIFWLNNHWW